MKRQTPPRDLTESFYVAVVLGGRPSRRGTLPCWYGANVETPLNCEGRIIASHVVKRRRIENFLGAQIPHELVALAAWDPRNAVPSCQDHDDRLDGHLMPPLVIPRPKLPPEVIEFCEEWGLEFELERRFPVR